MLLQHIHHWGQFRFISNVSGELESFIKAVEGEDAPLLERLILQQLGDDDDDELTGESSPPVKIFNGPGSAPLLVQVDLCGIQLDWDNRPFRNPESLSLIGLRSADELRIDQFKSVLLESQQLARLRLAGDVLRPDDLTTAFQRTGQTPPPISLPCLDTLLVSHYSAPDILNFTLSLIHAPNLKKLRLANLHSDAEGFDIDFATTFEFLGTGTFSSFEHLEALELRRVSCCSGAAWNVFCAKLTKLQDMRLGYISDGPTEHDDVYAGYLSALVRPLNGDRTGKSRLKVGEWTVIDFAMRRLKTGCGIPRIVYGGDKPSNIMVDALANLGVGFDWDSDTDSEAGSVLSSDDEVDDDSNL
ncbi:hypothetical protein FRC01_009833 [Tulasnella sp. 417]|nr:hypothetical protein FRC01_009833 [Tulasnella sp. 417]